MSEDIDGVFTTARTTASEQISHAVEDFRAFLIDLDDPRLADVRGMDYETFSRHRTSNPFVRELLASWKDLYRAPFVGITTDGIAHDRPLSLPPLGTNDPLVVAAADRLLAALSTGERRRLVHPSADRKWRAWSNPEFVIHRVGLRLELLPEETVRAVEDLIEASLSEIGAARVREVMALNGILGELTELPRILGPLSYWFSIFGTPSLTEPWGWQIFGHHLAVNVAYIEGRVVIAPLFLGAEPAFEDGSRLSLFGKRTAIAQRLAGSFTPAQRQAAVVYDSVLDPAMPRGRIHPADERHVAGAFQDNRIIPYEGLCARELDEHQRRLVLDFASDALALLPPSQLEAMMVEVDNHFGETWLSWYGPTDGSGPIYFRLHSPVLLTELDHHAGVWLSNAQPQRFHVHTTLRLPAGNDYGYALRRQWHGDHQPVPEE